MANPTLTKTFTADENLIAYGIVKMGAEDYGVGQADAATDILLGVTTEIAANSGDPTDVVLQGIAFVKLGGSVTRGDWITAASGGVGVTAAPAATATAGVIGKALQSGSSGDVIEVFLSLSGVTNGANS